MIKTIKFLGPTRKVWTNGMTFHRDVETSVPAAIAERLLKSASFVEVSVPKPKAAKAQPVQEATPSDDVSSGAALLIPEPDHN